LAEAKARHEEDARIRELEAKLEKEKREAEEAR